jgi:hypothetical protein
MKKQVIVDRLTIAELKDIFWTAREKIGISAGQQIPNTILNFEYEILNLLFTKAEIQDE